MSIDLRLPVAPINYEKRIVIFFDVLGWRNHIQAASENPEEIAKLNLVVQTLSLLRQPGLVSAGDGSHLATFSDNVVFSRPYAEDELTHFLSAISKIEFGISLMGFYLRGAVTIGNLHHTGDVVFGPALIRAYDLERSAAVYPRVILDPLVPEFATIEHPLVIADSGYRMIDSFSVDAIKQMMTESPPMQAIHELKKKTHWADAFVDFAKVCGSEVILLDLAVRLLDTEMTKCLPEGAREKLQWLRKRMIKGLAT